MSDYYDHQAVEKKWRQLWEEQKLFQQSQDQQVTRSQDKEYLLFAFAYPSGSGLHVGHVESATALDILARYQRMHDKKVFFPVGWDAFGLPAENYAIKTGVPPSETTNNAINTFRRQIKQLGVSYDWANEIATCHPGYYKWTQWLFVQLFNAGLAYQDTGRVNWCPSCQTVLANEQVVNGLCERCDTEVIQKEMEQWFFKITKYKDELISGLEQVDWPEPTKQQQLNWIGKKEGAEVTFKIEGGVGHTEVDAAQVTCFTTRIDTIFGVTFVVLSPEKYQQLGLDHIVSNDYRSKVAHYIEQAFKKTEEERQIGEKDKTGVDTGLRAVNPANGESVPVYVADYVLAGYGTGAVMGVPAHDERDWAFAKKHELKISQVIDWTEQEEAKQEEVEQEGAKQDNEVCQFTVEQWQSGYAEHGKMINSGEFNGLDYDQARQQLPEKFPDSIKLATTYKLRDWLISRQRYWGAPIPIVYDPEGNPHPVKEEHLPWTLPTDVEFKPTGESPLRDSQEFKERTEQLYGKGWTPEYDTMDTFVDSSWYYLRYTDARNEEEFASKEQLEKWLPVDFYMIGPEHIVLHLLYSRFFTKFLRDQGFLDFDEPFMKMRHQGMILGPDGKKMSKSKGNVVNPDDVVVKFGADTLRMYEMFLGPIEADKPWDTNAVTGVYRFLQRVHQYVSEWVSAEHTEVAPEAVEQLRQKLHQTIKKVTHDIPDLKFNTAIAAMMEFVNEWQDAGSALRRDEVLSFIKILAPFAPFLAEELYQQVVRLEDVSEVAESVHLTTWPEWDEGLAQENMISIAVQVNGKVRGQLEVDRNDLDNRAEILIQAKSLPDIQRWLDEGEIVKEIYVPGRIVSLVVS